MTDPSGYLIGWVLALALMNLYDWVKYRLVKIDLIRGQAAFHNSLTLGFRGQFAAQQKVLHGLEAIFFDKSAVEKHKGNF